MENLIKFVERLKKINVNIKLVGNFPWVYLTEINGKKVVEKSFSDSNWTLGFCPISKDESPDFKFYKLPETFNLIREYL